MKFESCILRKIDDALTVENKREIERIIEMEIFRATRTLNCVFTRYSNSNLTLTLNEFNT